jgi:hypothetical protein
LLDDIDLLKLLVTHLNVELDRVKSPVSFNNCDISTLLVANLIQLPAIVDNMAGLLAMCVGIIVG